mgnify:CR=1 FL=1
MAESVDVSDLGLTMDDLQKPLPSELTAAIASSATCAAATSASSWRVYAITATRAAGQGAAIAASAERSAIRTTTWHADISASAGISAGIDMSLHLVERLLDLKEFGCHR